MLYVFQGTKREVKEVPGATRRIQNTISAKSFQEIPIKLGSNPQLRTALIKLSRISSRPRTGPVIRSQRGGNLTAGSVVNWFTALYASTGMSGCSSHSGRRTFITRSARLLAKVGGSLRDIQELAGHSSLQTTEVYLHGDRKIQHKLVRLL